MFSSKCIILIYVTISYSRKTAIVILFYSLLFNFYFSPLHSQYFTSFLQVPLLISQYRRDSKQHTVPNNTVTHTLPT